MQQISTLGTSLIPTLFNILNTLTDLRLQLFQHLRHTLVRTLSYADALHARLVIEWGSEPFWIENGFQYVCDDRIFLWNKCEVHCRTQNTYWQSAFHVWWQGPDQEFPCHQWIILMLGGGERVWTVVLYIHQSCKMLSRQREMSSIRSVLQPAKYTDPWGKIALHLQIKCACTAKVTAYGYVLYLSVSNSWIFATKVSRLIKIRYES